VLQLSHISKTFGINTILADVSFVLSPGERVGLVGANGSGKTTLLRIIAGLEHADSGSVTFMPPDWTVGYLAQGLAFDPAETVAQVLARANADHSEARAAMQHFAGLMANAESHQELAAATQSYAAAELRFEAAGGYELEPRLEAVLAGLGLAEISREMPVAHLSGGQKTRLGMAGLLIRQPGLLLLDEPTNHLDLDALGWLEDWLLQYRGAVLIVSHDRAFLDVVTQRTLVIAPDTHTLRDYPGNYSAYVDAVSQEIEQQWLAYHNQQQEIAQLQNAARHLRGLAKFRRGGKADTADKFAKGFFANRSAGTVGRAKQVERRIERLLTDERIDKPARRWPLRVNFADDDSGARQVVQLQQVRMSFDEHILLQDISATLTHGQRVVLTGPNGAGKTTLLRLIAGELQPTAGDIRLGSGVKTGYYSQEQEILKGESCPYDTIRAVANNMDQTETRSFLHFFLFSGDAVSTKNSSLSYGERARLMLAVLVAQGCNFLLLDEPVNHLDITSREQFEAALDQFPGTVLAVAHDRAFIRRIASATWHLSAGRVRIKPL
jgi:ATPase subunit of ABC transporter with duplicated ATPase domains